MRWMGFAQRVPISRQNIRASRVQNAHTRCAQAKAITKAFVLSPMASTQRLEARLIAMKRRTNMTEAEVGL